MNISSLVVHLTDDNFKDEVIKHKIPVLVSFSAGWCPPCKMIAKSVESIASKYEGRLKVGKLDVEEAEETSKKYGIQSLPTLLIFKGTKVVGQIIGAAPQSRLEAEIDKHLK